MAFEDAVFLDTPESLKPAHDVVFCVGSHTLAAVVRGDARRQLQQIVIEWPRCRGDEPTSSQRETPCLCSRLYLGLGGRLQTIWIRGDKSVPERRVPLVKRKSMRRIVPSGSTESGRVMRGCHDRLLSSLPVASRVVSVPADRPAKRDGWSGEACEACRGSRRSRSARIKSVTSIGVGFARRATSSSAPASIQPLEHFHRLAWPRFGRLGASRL